ncbi:MAG: hypothetical protein IJ851_02670 [Eubacterium sp.]|nr:hypothetical protein [Eubacterium sp.]
MSRGRTLYKINRAFSYLTSFLLFLTILGSFVVGIATVTIGNTDFKASYFTSPATINTLVKELDENMTDLCEEEDIPKEVFINTTGYNFISSIQRTVIDDTVTTEPTNFSYTSTIIGDYKKALTTYDEKNGIERSNEETDRIVQEAVDIFNKTCSIQNNQSLSSWANVVNSKLLPMIFAILIIVSLMLGSAISRLFGGRKLKYNFIAMSFTSAGGIMILIPLISIFSGIMGRINLTNIDAYNEAIKQCVNSMFVVFIIFGALLAGIGAALFAWTYKYYRFRLLESDTEAEIKRNLVD